MGISWMQRTGSSSTSGLVLTLIALASVGVAGYARELGIGSVNLFLWTGVTVGLLGLLMHELRPFRSRTTMTFDPAAVEARKKEIAEAETSTKAKATKKRISDEGFRETTYSQ